MQCYNAKYQYLDWIFKFPKDLFSLVQYAFHTCWAIYTMYVLCCINLRPPESFYDFGAWSLNPPAVHCNGNQYNIIIGSISSSHPSWWSHSSFSKFPQLVFLYKLVLLCCEALPINTWSYTYHTCMEQNMQAESSFKLHWLTYI